MNKIFFFLLSCLLLQSNAQNDTLKINLLNSNLLNNIYKNHQYIDTNLNLISREKYTNRCKNETLKCKNITLNDTIYHLIFTKFKFGKLNKHKFNRLKYYIFKDTSYSNNFIIHFKDQLLSFNEFKKKRNEKIQLNNLTYEISQGSKEPPFKSNCLNGKKIVLKNNQSLPSGKWVKIGGNKYRVLQKKKLLSDVDITVSQKKVAQRTNKCMKKYKKKYSTDLLHYYNIGDNSLNPDIKWVKDKNKLIRNYFFKYTNNYYFAIIKSNGEYLLIGSLITPKKIKKLLKNDDWSKYKEDLKKSEKARKAIGFFEMQHIHNCL